MFYLLPELNSHFQGVMVKLNPAEAGLQARGAEAMLFIEVDTAPKPRHYLAAQCRMATS